MSQVFRIVYTQTLIGDETGALTEARPDVHFQIGYSAIETGWLRHFQRRWSDLGFLIGLGLHTRPLIGDDFELLRDLKLVRPHDKGRLYARITDLGLSEVTGIERVNGIPQCAQRLAANGFVRVLNLPDQFRDSRGQFSGRHAYLLLGSVVSQSADREGLSLTGTRHREGLPLTVHEGLSLTKNIPSSSTLSNESGATGAPWVGSTQSTFSNVPALALGTATDGSTPDAAGNVSGAHRAADTANTSAAGDRLAAELNHALTQPKVAEAYLNLLTSTHELDAGFTADGLRLAALMLKPLPERRRQVLDDLRRMQGRADLKTAKRRHYVIGILTQQIGATLGLGFEAQGRLRVVPTKSDYAAIGGLLDEHGAEALWLTACSIAGLAIEGDPIDYLRATLRRQRDRLRQPNGQPPSLAGLCDHAALDYASVQVLPQEASVV